MAYTANQYKYTYVYQDLNPVNGSVNASYPSTQLYATYIIDKPASSYRVKPADLFANSTPRTVLRTYYSSTFGTINVNIYTRYLNMPFSNYYNAGNASYPVVSKPDFEGMRNQIRNNLRGSASNLAMCLAEYKQTAKLFADSSRYVANGFTGVPKTSSRDRLGNRIPVGFDNPRQMSKKVAKRYLAYQYGVKPLCSDLLNSFDELNKRAAVKPIVRMGIMKRKTQGMRSSLLSSNSGGFPAAQATVTTTFESRTRWRAVMKADSVGVQLTRHGFTNPFSLAYELIPYSFVLDWWINVGEVLASLDNLSIASSLTVIESYRRIDIIELRAATKVINGASKTMYINDYRGSPSGISLINTLQYKPSSSLTHIANGIALLRVARR